MFFRNDDVRGKLDPSLCEITELFIKQNIPITHAVEPGNLTPEVVKWLVKTKEQHPQLIEIMQHGYDHSVKNFERKGEFGGQRNYAEQYVDIMKGKELMNTYFGDLWFEAFNFPYAPYNEASIRALDDCEFKVVNSHFNNRISRRLFYNIGRKMKRGRLFDKHISWNLDYYPNSNLFEIDVNTGFIKKYYDEIDNCEMLSFPELKEETKRYMTQQTIGVLLHHRYHNTSEKIRLIEDYLIWCKTLPNIIFSTIQNIYQKFSSQMPKVS